MRAQIPPRGLLAPLRTMLGFAVLILLLMPACGDERPETDDTQGSEPATGTHGDLNPEPDSGLSGASADSVQLSDSEEVAHDEGPTSSDGDLGVGTGQQDVEPSEGDTSEADIGDDSSSGTTPGVCVAGTYREGSDACGSDSEGRLVQRCRNDQWDDTGLCLLGAAGHYDALNLGAGYGAPEWDYDEVAPPARGVYGWSYYIRAFDLIRDTPVNEIGWGQWSKPSMPADGLDVCGLHPHGFTCEEVEDSEFEGDLASCGHLDWQSMEDCRVWCCAEDDKCGVRGSIEGGMGYWMYTLQTPHVKWMLPGATNANYEIFGGTFLHDRPQSCTTLGGAVRVSNRLLVPNDFVSFSGDDIDGFLGYMLTRTPLLKRTPSDNANAWTIVIDAGNFAGPVMVMAPWFWDSRINWHPQSVSWSDPRALIGYIAEGFEGRIGAISVRDAAGTVWRRTNRWAFPRDIVDGDAVMSSTLFTGHSQYDTDWAAAAMEPMLAGTGTLTSRTPDAVRSAAMAAGRLPGSGCNLPGDYSALELELEQEEGDTIWQGFGVGAEVTDPELEAQASAAVGCHTKLSLDPTKLNCGDKWCEGARYLKLDASTGQATVVASDALPDEVAAALDVRDFQGTRRNDGRYLGPPAESEAPCFERPGPAPADPRLYCTRTESGVWIGFRWYRFVDQPELNQAFASLPADERDAAKCFVQARIERLHVAQQADDGVPRWFEFPGTDPTTLPASKVSIDPGLLLTPPVGLEQGFVPIPVIERKRVKPEGCEVVLGAIQSEPSPLPQDYYEGYAYDGGDYDPELCPANLESGAEFSYPGTIFPYPTGSDPYARTPYKVPTRSELSATLSDQATSCGLPSDPPGASSK